jgi:hypothetical protein
VTVEGRNQSIGDDMTGAPDPDLQRRLDELEAENAALRTQAIDRGAEPTDTVALDVVPGKKKRGRGWTVLATVLIVIGTLLAPVALAASWAKIQLSDTDRFVSAFAPLADNPDVQAYITDQVVTLIDSRVDIPSLTSEVIDGITSLGTGPTATAALNSLKGVAASGLESLVQSTVANLVDSDAFATVWTQALRISHNQLENVMSNDSGSAVVVGSNGSIGIQLGPIVDQVKAALLARNVSFASKIPTVDKTITVVQSSNIPQTRSLYHLAVALGNWLPWITLLFLAAGVLVARRKSVALIWAAVAFGFVMLLTAIGVDIGQTIFIQSVSPSLLPAAVGDALWGAVFGGMQAVAAALVVLAALLVVVAWFAGPFAISRKLRGFFGDGTAVVRESAEKHGITTGAVGQWIYQQRVLLHVLVAVVAAALVLFVRPLTVGLVVWTLVIAVIVIVVLEFVQRPVTVVPANSDDDTPVVVAG